jgi:hypothetical protein
MNTFSFSVFPVNKCDSDLLLEAGGTIFAERERERERETGRR